MDHEPTDERPRCFLKAQIVFNQRMSAIDCIIRNMSATGARIEVDGSIAIPQTFDLEIPCKGIIRRASAQWRDMYAVGVAFVRDTAALEGESALAAENRELRQRLEVLSRQLRQPTEV